MKKQLLHQKIVDLGVNNKKVLQSISAYVITQQNEREKYRSSYELLRNEYQQLYKFSKQTVNANEELQHQINDLQNIIRRLEAENSKLLDKCKEQTEVIQILKSQDNRHKISNQQEIKRLNFEINEKLRRFNLQKNQQLERYQLDKRELEKINQQLIQKFNKHISQRKQVENSLHKRIKNLEQQLQSQQKEYQQLKEKAEKQEKQGLQKKNKARALSDVQSMIRTFRQHHQNT